MRDTASQVTAVRTPVQWLRPLTAGVLLLLAVQFLVGMVVNLFVVLPAAHPGRDASEYFGGVAQGVAWALTESAWSLKLHAVVGLLLFVGALAILGLAIASRRRAWIVASSLGLVGIMGAGFNGASFMNYGHDFSSLLMAIGYLLAVIAYAVGYEVTR